MTRFHTQLTRR